MHTIKHLSLIIILTFAVSVSYSNEKQEVKSHYAISRELLALTPEPKSMETGDEFIQPVAKKKSAPLAVLLSLAVPGMGEWYAGSFSSGKLFLIAEAGLWLTYSGFNTYGTWVRNDAKEYARANAGVNWNSKDDNYFVNIGNYLSIDEYNKAKLLNRQSEKVYNPPAGYYWKWESNKERLTYRTMRINSDVAYNDLKFVGTAVMLNHIASAVNAALSVRSFNKSLQQSSLEIQVHPLYSESHKPDGVMFSLAKGF